jgi:hypothetical protein
MLDTTDPRPRKGNTEEENTDLEGRLEYLKIFEQTVM